MKGAGAGTLGVLTGLAGCTGGDGGGGGEGGGGDGGGGGGGDGSGGGDGGGDGPTATQEQSLTPVKMGFPPWANILILNHIQQEGILSERMNEAGYELTEIVKSWDEVTLFAAGQTDFSPSVSDIEGAVLASQRELDLTYHALQAPNYEGWYVRPDSDMHPDNTGSVAATLQKAIDEQRPVGFGGFNQGAVWPNAYCLHEEFDIPHGTPEMSPFNLRKSDLFTDQKLLAQGETDLILQDAPILGTDTYGVQENPEIVPIYWNQRGMENAGLSPRHLNLGMFTTTQEFSDNNVEFVRAFMDAWLRGVEWVKNTDNWPDILDDEDNWALLTAEDRETAKYNLEFSYQMKHSNNVFPIAFDEISLTDDKIDGTINAINTMVEIGMPVNENWQEYIEFKKVSPDSA